MSVGTVCLPPDTDFTPALVSVNQFVRCPAPLLFPKAYYYQLGRLIVVSRDCNGGLLGLGNMQNCRPWML